MTDYWKSYAKKFCEICKCWYADNKISVERHETGERHKAMVQQRIRESAKKAKDKEIANHDIKMTLYAMEQAAIASMTSGRQSEVPIMPAEDLDYPGSSKPVEDDPNQALKEQRKKLKELKRTAKQSQFWVEDDQIPDGEEIAQKSAKFTEEQTNAEEQNGINIQFEGPPMFLLAPVPYNPVPPKVTYQTFAGKKTKDFTSKPANANAFKVKEYKRELPEEIILQPLKADPDEAELNERSTSNHGHPGLGPWIPVIKNDSKQRAEKPIAAEDTKSKRYDDLPEQEYGPGTRMLAQVSAELLQVAEMDPEDLAFKQKELPSEQTKKKSKIIGFRRPAINSTNKSLRNKTSN